MAGERPGAAEPVRRRVVVDGRVQGVWFRGACQEQAARLGVDGWVRNRNDGRVEAVFEGPPLEVAAMVEWCRRGPAHATVTAVDVTPEAPEGLRGFRVRR